MREVDKLKMKELKEEADCYAVIHKTACESWTHGNVKDAWKDKDGNICVQYEDGTWWHYRTTPGGVEWW